MFYVVRNEFLFCIAISNRETFSKNENFPMTTLGNEYDYLQFVIANEEIRRDSSKFKVLYKQSSAQILASKTFREM